jgi:hypothetical protein
MKRGLVRTAGAAIGAVLALHTAAGYAQAPSPQEFAWRAGVDLPAGASMARVSLPAQALVRLQSADARDVRVFNAGGQAVAFSFLGTAAQATPAPAYTRAYNALALYSASTGSAPRPGKGSMRVRIEDQQRSVWVQIDGQPPTAAAATRLNSVIFATQGEKQRVGALKVQATLPPNAPVRVAVSTSTDLANWSAVPVRGRLYRFEGDGAPANDTLEFDQPVHLEGRYLRLDWSGQEGVAVGAVTGVVAPAVRPPVRVRAELPPAQTAAKDTADLALPFATPIASLVLASAQPNTLLPVRILGRNDAAQPWRVLGQAVVYRLGDSINPPIALNGTSVRWLRLVATNGADIAAAQLQASAEFEPVRLVFVATGNGPFEVAAGRANTPAAALPLGVLASALGDRKAEDIPEARLGAATVAPVPEPGPLARFRPAGVSDKAAVLWGVLIAGVLLLAGVAWSLLRQLKAPPAVAE